MVRADKDQRKHVFLSAKVTELWEEGEEFGDFVARLRKKYAKKVGTDQIVLLVA